MVQRPASRDYGAMVTPVIPRKNARIFSIVGDRRGRAILTRDDGRPYRAVVVAGWTLPPNRKRALVMEPMDIWNKNVLINTKPKSE